MQHNLVYAPGYFGSVHENSSLLVKRVQGFMNIFFRNTPITVDCKSGRQVLPPRDEHCFQNVDSMPPKVSEPKIYLGNMFPLKLDNRCSVISFFQVRAHFSLIAVKASK